MAMLGAEYQAKTKAVDGILVGVAQVRLGKPSVRAAGTAAVKAAQAVTQSTLKAVEASDGTTVQVIRPTDTANTGTATLTASGTYSGTYDGAYIVRIEGTGATGAYRILGPDGVTTTGNLSGSALTHTNSGITITGTFTNHAIGDTWIVPVWAGTATDKVQTGIICPYSLFSKSNESVGNVSDASFTPKLDSVKTLESGFPASTDDRIVEKTSVDIQFTAKEFTNATIAQLTDMISSTINESGLPSISCEVVCRTKGGAQESFWVPNASITNFPAISPKNDYSDLQWSLGASKMTEITGETAAYNAHLSNTWIYYRLRYIH